MIYYSIQRGYCACSNRITPEYKSVQLIWCESGTKLGEVNGSLSLSMPLDSFVVYLMSPPIVQVMTCIMIGLKYLHLLIA